MPSPRGAISPSARNLPGTGRTLEDKAAAPKPRCWVAPGTAVEVCPRRRALLHVHRRSGPPLLLRKDHPVVVGKRRYPAGVKSTRRPWRRADGALLPPGGRGPGGTSEVAGQRARARWEGAQPPCQRGRRLPRPAQAGQQGWERARCRCRLTWALLVVCPCPSHQAASLLFHVGPTAHSSRGPGEFYLWAVYRGKGRN